MKKPNWLKFGAEAILTVMIVPFLVWVVTSIFTLDSRIGASEKINDERISTIKAMIEKQDKSLEKQDLKLDKIMEILLGRK